MPQLDSLTFLSQVSWLIILFIIFYNLLLQYALPNIVVVFKARRKLGLLTTKSSFLNLLTLPNNQMYVQVTTLFGQVVAAVNRTLESNSTKMESFVSSMQKHLIHSEMQKFNGAFYGLLVRISKYQLALNRYYVTKAEQLLPKVESSLVLAKGTDQKSQPVSPRPQTGKKPGKASSKVKTTKKNLPLAPASTPSAVPAPTKKRRKNQKYFS